jgi:hypothetical protein
MHGKYADVRVNECIAYLMTLPDLSSDHRTVATRAFGYSEQRG